MGKTGAIFELEDKACEGPCACTHAPRMMFTLSITLAVNGKAAMKPFIWLDGTRPRGRAGGISPVLGSGRDPESHHYLPARWEA